MKRKQEKCSSARTLQDISRELHKIKAEKGSISKDDYMAVIKNADDFYVEVSATASNPLTVNLRLATNPEEAERLQRQKRENAQTGQKVRGAGREGGKASAEGKKREADAVWTLTQRAADLVWQKHPDWKPPDVANELRKKAKEEKSELSFLLSYKLDTIRKKIKKLRH